MFFTPTRRFAAACSLTILSIGGSNRTEAQPQSGFVGPDGVSLLQSGFRADRSQPPLSANDGAESPEEMAFEQIEYEALEASAAAKELLNRAAWENERDAARRVERAVQTAHVHENELPGHEFANSALLATGLLKTNASNPAEFVGCGNGHVCSGHGTCSAVSGACECEEGWIGMFCDTTPCPEDCNDKGICIDRRCICEADRYGEKCQHRRCPNDCSGNGYCFQGSCHCTGDYGGETCDEIVNHGQVITFKLPEKLPVLKGYATLAASTVRSVPVSECPAGCSEHGTCLQSGFCECDPGYSGESCSDICPNACSGNGDCIDGSCLCYAGWTTSDCSAPGCCSGHGTCDTPDGSCLCDQGWAGQECNYELECEDPTCSGHGVCSHGICLCASGYSGQSCELGVRSCEGLCGDYGTCDYATSQCVCGGGWFGPFCDVQETPCLNGCSGNGRCFEGTCSCFAEFEGQDCSVQVSQVTEPTSADAMLVVQHTKLPAESPCRPGLEFVQVDGVRVNCNSDPVLLQQQADAADRTEDGQFPAAISKDSAGAAPVTASWIPTALAATVDALQVKSGSFSVAVDEAAQSEGSGGDVVVLSPEEPSALAFASQTALATWVTGGKEPRSLEMPPALNQQHHFANESPEDSESPEEQRLLELGVPAAVADAPQHPGQYPPPQQPPLLLHPHKDESSMLQETTLVGLLTSASEPADTVSVTEIPHLIGL